MNDEVMPHHDHKIILRILLSIFIDLVLSPVVKEMNDVDGRKNWDFDGFPALKNERRKNEE